MCQQFRELQVENQDLKEKNKQLLDQLAFVEIHRNHRLCHVWEEFYETKSTYQARENSHSREAICLPNLWKRCGEMGKWATLGLKIQQAALPPHVSEL